MNIEEIKNIVTDGYRSILKRESDPSGFDHYVGEISSGRISVERFLEILRTSEEHRFLLITEAINDYKKTYPIKKKIGRIAICTIRSSEVDKYARLTTLIMRRYCDINGYDFIEHSGTFDPSRYIGWSKIRLVENCLNIVNDDTQLAYDWIVWLDADIVITNKSKKIEDIIGGAGNSHNIIAAKEDGYSNVINTGVFIIKNSEWSKNFLKKWYNQIQFISQGWMDNSAFIYLYENDPDVRWHTKLVKQRVLNSFVSTPCMEEGSWQSGDFIIHFAGYPNRDSSIVKFIEENIGIL